MPISMSLLYKRKAIKLLDLGLSDECRIKDFNMLVSLISYIAFSLFFIIDIYLDLEESIPLSHVWHEVLLLIVSLSALTWQLWVIFQKNKHIANISSELLSAKKSYQEWKERSQASSKEIRNMIDQQFKDWSLTESEKDVAMLLIKGFSMKEIAEFRNGQEKTVRQHASSVYKKAGLSGRQELAAFFLEDIFSTPN